MSRELNDVKKLLDVYLRKRVLGRWNSRFKGLGPMCVWHIPRTEKRPLRLEWCELKEGGRR